MDEIVLLHCIKGEPKTSLIDCLLCHGEEKLAAIAQEHKLEFDDKLTKNEIAVYLAARILINFKKDLSYLQEHELVFLHKFMGTAPIEMDDIKYVEYRTLNWLGYIFLFSSNKHIYPVIPMELLKMLSDVFNDSFKLKSAHNQKIYSYTIALLNIYGAYDIEQLVEVWNTHNKEKITIDEANEYIDVMCTRQGYFWFDENYIISDYFEDDEYYDLLEKTAHRQYFIPKKSDVEFYSQNEYDNKSIFYKKVEDFIKSKNIVAENKLEDILYDISDACMMDKHPSEIIDILNVNDFTFEGIDEINVFIKLVIELSNNTRKWVLRGYMPSELFEMYEKPFLKPLPKQPFEINHKVGRNDTCTCGSGFKFKKCCGK